jgi:hypothetical protein
MDNPGREAGDRQCWMPAVIHKYCMAPGGGGAVAVCLAGLACLSRVLPRIHSTKGDSVIVCCAAPGTGDGVGSAKTRGW